MPVALEDGDGDSVTVAVDALRDTVGDDVGGDTVGDSVAVGGVAVRGYVGLRVGLRVRDTAGVGLCVAVSE